MSSATLCPSCSAPLRGFARRCRECDWTQPPAAKPAPGEEPAAAPTIPDYVRVRALLSDAERALDGALDLRRTGAHALAGAADRKAALYWRAAAGLLDGEGRQPS